MKVNYKPRTAKCKVGKHDNCVEPNQTMTVAEMLYAYTKGADLPQKFGSYDENISVDEIGYSISDRLEAVDVLNAVNQRIHTAKAKAETETITETSTVTTNEGE